MPILWIYNILYIPIHKKYQNLYNFVFSIEEIIQLIQGCICHRNKQQTCTTGKPIFKIRLPRMWEPSIVTKLQQKNKDWWHTPKLHSKIGEFTGNFPSQCTTNVSPVCDTENNENTDVPADALVPVTLEPRASSVESVVRNTDAHGSKQKHTETRQRFKCDSVQPSKQGHNHQFLLEVQRQNVTLMSIKNLYSVESWSIYSAA